MASIFVQPNLDNLGTVKTNGKIEKQNEKWKKKQNDFQVGSGGMMYDMYVQQ